MPARLLLEVVRVDLNVLLLIVRHVVVRIDRVHRTHGLAGAAVNTDFWIDVKLRIIVGRVDAVYRASLNAGLVLHPYTGFRDYISQCLASFSALLLALPSSMRVPIVPPPQMLQTLTSSQAVVAAAVPRRSDAGSSTGHEQTARRMLPRSGVARPSSFLSPSYRYVNPARSASANASPLSHTSHCV